MGRKEEIQQQVEALMAEHDQLVEVERAEAELKARVAERLPAAFYSELGVAQARLKRLQDMDTHLARAEQELVEQIAFMDEHGMEVKKAERQRLLNIRLQRSLPQPAHQAAVARAQADVNRLQARLDQAEAQVKATL